MQNAPFGAFRNTCDLHEAINGLETKLLVFSRVVVLDRFYCTGIRLHLSCSISGTLVDSIEQNRGSHDVANVSFENGRIMLERIFHQN